MILKVFHHCLFAGGHVWLSLRFMASIKKLLDEHVAAGDTKPAAITNGTSGPSFAPKPRGFMATEDDNGFDVNQDFTKAGYTPSNICRNHELLAYVILFGYMMQYYNIS